MYARSSARQPGTVNGPVVSRHAAAGVPARAFQPIVIADAAVAASSCVSSAAAIASPRSTSALAASPRPSAGGARQGTTDRARAPKRPPSRYPASPRRAPGCARPVRRRRRRARRNGCRGTRRAVGQPRQGAVGQRVAVRHGSQPAGIARGMRRSPTTDSNGTTGDSGRTGSAIADASAGVTSEMSAIGASGVRDAASSTVRY